MISTGSGNPRCMVGDIPSTLLADPKQRIADRLAEARQHTLDLLAPLTEEQMQRIYTPLLSPLIWDLGHIASFEDLWLVQTIGGREPLRGELGDLYDAIEQPRDGRGELPILSGAELGRYLGAVRARTLEVLEEVELDGPDALLADGYVYELVLAHEAQHNETMLQLIQMTGHYAPQNPRSRPAATASIGPEMIRLETAEHEIGAHAYGFAYDNERGCHVRSVAGFEIDRLPVTNAQFAAFIADTNAEVPLYWSRDGAGGWVRTTMGRTRELEPDDPVCHVDAAQAEAYAAWAGKRLPSEFEWEVAAAGADSRRANLGGLGFGTHPAAASPQAGSTAGALAVLGDVWEWTASAFAAYPGFRAHPYREYSEVFFGDAYRVLRGGSWASGRDMIRTTFRNWDHPERRQIFAGFRCARDI